MTNIAICPHYQDDDDDYEPSDNKKKSKKGKKRKGKGEEKSKNRKKKKRRKNSSDDEEEQQADSAEEYSSSKKGRKKKERDREERSSRRQQATEEQPADAEAPSVEEVCEQLDLKDVDIEYSENHYQNLVTYKMFTQFVRPILTKENPKAPSSKLMMLIAAKWREFCLENPNLKDDEDQDEQTAEKSASENDEEEEEEEEEPEPEYQPKASRSRPSRNAEKQQQQQEEEEEDDDDDDDNSNSKQKKKRSNVRTSKRGKKQKVPTLKIRFGKKKDASSDDEKVTLNKKIKLKIPKLTQLIPPNRTAMPQARNETVMPSLKRCCLKPPRHLMKKPATVAQLKVPLQKESQKSRLAIVVARRSLKRQRKRLSIKTTAKCVNKEVK